ncbi:substrate-binding domain-containing protein [Paracoccus aerodenitrificans]|uniref:substrate-binding domain-containing protein n=1 Tax=Paracoccus aerodenitrificans TaxID=3017781 RepID=UPI0022EFF025|nr:substrate-binding domain-containing protein [Paracoccus aerodenitrificans]WBU65470.1 substrate-binding domain-containing protein [Paracoccus aerodenitrificans]
MATLKDVAKAAGLSVTQVSRALNNHSDVSKTTRERVHKVARSLRYQPNLSARKLVSGRSGMVGLVEPRTPHLASDGLFMEVVAGLSTQFSEIGMQFVLHIARPDEPILPVYQRLIGNGALDGFVLTHPEENDPRASLLADEDVPFVVHGRIGEAAEHAYFDIDNEGILYEITRHLTGLGHKNIAFFNGLAGRSYVTARERGYLKALNDSGIPAANALIRNGEMTEAFGLLSTVELFSGGALPVTAIICSNSRIAKGVYQAVGAMNLSVPDDISVMAHDDHVANLETAAFYPALSVTDAPLRESWAPLARCLAEAIDGAPLSQLQQVGPHRIFLRQSTAAPPRSNA